MYSGCAYTCPSTAHANSFPNFPFDTVAGVNEVSALLMPEIILSLRQLKTPLLL